MNLNIAAICLIIFILIYSQFMSLWNQIIMQWTWTYAGVNSDIPRNTGTECVEFLSVKRHWFECTFIILTAMTSLYYGVSIIKPINSKSYAINQKQLPVGRKILLVAMTFILGVEIGFKFASQTLIYILNPCHITTMIQIYLLATKPSKGTVALFRIHMNYLNGPLLAFLFPETDTRLLPMESKIYWIQHGFMFIIPIYLLRESGPYLAEEILDISWNIIAYAILLIYHFVLLQLVSIPTEVNLNHMLCPALLDPFEGPNYRLIACLHQALLCPLLCKIFYILFAPKRLNDDNKKLNSTIEVDNSLWKFNDTKSDMKLNETKNVNNSTGYSEVNGDSHKEQ